MESVEKDASVNVTETGNSTEDTVKSNGAEDGEETEEDKAAKIEGKEVDGGAKIAEDEL